jgi:hypothetical protein
MASICIALAATASFLNHIQVACVDYAAHLTHLQMSKCASLLQQHHMNSIVEISIIVEICQFDCPADACELDLGRYASADAAVFASLQGHL